MTATGSRACCASWRRRFWARSCGATATSTPARTQCRRRCWRPRVQWPADGVPAQPQGLADHRRLPAPHRDVAQRSGPPAPGGDRRLRGNRPTPSRRPWTTTRSRCCCCAATLAHAGVAGCPDAARGGRADAPPRSPARFLVPEATVAQRISRAKQRIKASGAEFRMPPPEERAERIAAVQHVLYLIFNEGYTASSGPSLHRVELSAEAIRLTRQLHALLPDDGEVGRAARADAAHRRPPPGSDRRRRHPGSARRAGPPPVGRRRHRRGRRSDHRFAGQRADRPLPAAGRDRRGARRGARAPTDTDWRQILGLYDLLDHLAPGPMVTLNRIVAFAMVHGPRRRSGASSPRRRPIPPSPGTTGSTRCARTCWRWRASRRRRARSTARPPAAR